MLDALIPAASVLKEVLLIHCGLCHSFLYSLWMLTDIFNCHDQRLTAGDDPVDCFVLSSEAALSGAEATKNMQAQVILYFLKIFISQSFMILQLILIASIFS